jgi:PAS domain S-box-containing protein
MEHLGIITALPERLQFLSGKGEMVTLTRTKDWDKTPVGAVTNWPQSLRTTLSIILNSKFPMFLWWGQELVCFYNDAYRPSLGKNGKHPGILGMPAKDAWSEIWDVIKPLIDQVLNGGEATWSEDQLIPIYRNGTLEDVYWTFSYSPVHDESGKISGVLVTCSETTEKINSYKKLEDSITEFQFAIDTTELGIWDMNPQTSKFTANDRLKRWFGLNPDKEIKLENAIAVVADCDKLRVSEAINYALQFESHGYYDIEYTIIHPVTKKEKIVKAKGRTIFNDEQKAIRFNGTLQDITNRVNSEKKIVESEQNLRSMILQAPVSIAIFRGPKHVIEIANGRALELWGRKEEEVNGKQILEAMPELQQQGIKALLDDVYNTGNVFSATELPVNIKRNGKKQETIYVNFSYEPLYSFEGTINGIIAIGVEVTDQVFARRKVELSEQRLRAFVESASFPISVYTGKKMKIELANQAILEVWGKSNDVIGKFYSDALPEFGGEKMLERLDKVYTTGEPYHATNHRIDLVTNSFLKTYYFNYSFTPLYDINGKVYGVMNTAADVTDLNIAKQKVEIAEERLRLAVEATEIATWDLDLQTHEIIYSPRLLEIFGQPPSKVLAHSEMRTQIHPDDLHQIVEKAFDAALQSGVYKYEARVVKPDQEITWIRVQGKIFYDATDKPVKLIGTLREVTEEKEHQHELEESEQRFRLLANSMPQFIWTGDANGDIFYFSQAVYDYSGLIQEQILKKGWILLIHPDDREANIKAWANSITTGKDFLFEHRFRRYDGVYRWQLSRAIPQRDSTGKIQMWVGTSTDIQEMKEMDQQKDYFISLASHELKTPITSIKAYTQILLSKYSNSEDPFLIKSLNTVDKQVVKLTKLISDLLDLSKIKSGSLTLHREKFRINDLIHEVTGEIKHINPDYKIVFSEKVNTVLFADRERIGQVLTNLLTNAIKYSPQSNEIAIASTMSDNKLTITVKDFGIGINKNDQEKIFERFYRVEGKNEKTFPGFGIGLFIAMEIIHRHKGNIGVRSEPNKGSEFYFSLPVDNAS